MQNEGRQGRHDSDDGDDDNNKWCDEYSEFGSAVKLEMLGGKYGYGENDSSRPIVYCW